MPLPRWSSPRARSRSTTTRGRRRGPPPRAREVPSLPCPRERARASRDVVSVGSVFGLSRTRALLLLRMRGKPRDYLLQLGVKKGNLLSFLGFQGSTISGEIDLHPGFVSDRKKEEKKKDINLAGLAQGRLPRFLLKWPFGDPEKREHQKSAVAQSRNRRVVCRSKKAITTVSEERREDLNGRPRGAHNL